MNKPRVSVCVFAYNHEKYLSCALDSVLSQRVSFEFEVIIGEDYSTDSTLHIALDYQVKFPHLIRVVHSGHKEKLVIDGHATGRYNFLSTLANCSGEYIALLDGDDYWIDPLKLQRQFDFLERNPEYSIVFHNVYLEDSNSESQRDIAGRTYHPANFGKKVEMESLLLSTNIVPTSAAMVRNNIPSVFPGCFYKVSIGDWPFQVFNLNFGKVHYIEDIWGVYRTGTGIWSAKSREKQLLVIIETTRHLPEIIPPLLLPALKAACASHYQELIRQYRYQRRVFLYALTASYYFLYLITGKILTAYLK